MTIVLQDEVRRLQVQKHNGRWIVIRPILNSFILNIGDVLEKMEYSILLDLADECEDPYMRLVYTSSWTVSVYYAYQRTQKSFNPIPVETYEMVASNGVTFLAE